MKKKEIERIMENQTLLNILSPIGGIEYKKNYFRVGDYLGRVYAITKYPQKVRVGWLESIANIPNTVCTLNISPTEKDTLMQNISKGIRQNEIQYDSIKDAERKTGINSVYISQLCRGKGKQCFGYSWQYIEDLGEEE